jgi:hypothetical protein
MATGEGFAYLDQIPTTEQDLERFLSSAPKPVSTTQQLTQAERDALATLSPAERDALATLSPAELEALKQFNATATEEQKAMLRRMADGSAPAADAEPVTSSPNVDQATGDNVLESERAAEAQRIQDAENALEIIKDKLRDYGLEGLADEAYNMLLDGISAEAVILRLRDTEEFAARFPGLDLRRANGFSAISPAEYINLERQYRNVMMTAGIPEGFYDSVDDFAQFIGNDVSQAEMTERVALAATAARSIDPNLRLQLQEMYGVGVENDGELVAYYLDPERGTTVIEQRLQLEAAGLSAASIGALGAGFNTQTAERLVDLNVQAREVSERFRGQRAITQQLVGEDEFTSSEFAAAEFGLDSDATADLARLRALREQRGVRQSGALVTRAGAVGLGTAT